MDALEPETEGDWLIVAGDVGDLFGDVARTLGQLRSRFREVIWTPGNHELWTVSSDVVQLRGDARYRALVQMCHDIGVRTPEDEYALWDGIGGPALIAPVFVLYDYTFRAPGVKTEEESLARAYESGCVCTDEVLLHPYPYPDRQSWCRARVAITERRLVTADLTIPKVLVSHWPLDRRPTQTLRFPEFAQWCGTVRTADWHTRFQAAVAIYGHLHMPRTTTYEGVRFEEVSLGYPREWKTQSETPQPLRRVFREPV